MKILLIAPGFPAEMPRFTRGLAEVGAEVYGVADAPAEALPESARRSLAGYLRVESLWDEEAVVRQVREWPAGRAAERVECLWEPAMLLAARLREALGLPGLTVAETVPFRDKTRMKEALEKAGVRVPRHARTDTAAGCREAAERIGYPVVVKPVAGAGSADTYRVDHATQMEEVLPKLLHQPEVTVEEFIEGEEYTFDAVTIDGAIAYENISWYRPRPLIARTNEWISPQTIGVRDIGAAKLAGGRAMGAAVLEALGFKTGFTHMEWFLRPDGEAVFCEIGGRPPGARSVDTMNAADDIDLFRGWAEAVALGEFRQSVERPYNSAVIFKRAQGQGRIRRVVGLDEFLAAHGEHVLEVDLLPVGSQRRNWKQTLVSDGYILLRHPEIETTLAMADRVGTDIHLYAA